jgi:hypothetical protein
MPRKKQFLFFWEETMKKTAITVRTCLLFFILAIPTTPSVQGIRDKVAKKVQPYIDSATQNWSWMAIDLVLNGKNFPSKTGSGNIRRLIRLLSMGSVEGTKGSAFYVGQLGNWTPNIISDLIPIDIVVGRRFRIGLVEFDEFNPSVKNLISNQVELFILMNLDHVTPNPVPYSTTEIEVTTGNALGPQGNKIVKLGNQTVQITQWGAPGPPNVFKFTIPNRPPTPVARQLFVEENGIAVSRKVQVNLLGAKTE